MKTPQIAGLANCLMRGAVLKPEAAGVVVDCRKQVKTNHAYGLLKYCLTSTSIFSFQLFVMN